jgi:hypothetical protein
MALDLLARQLDIRAPLLMTLPVFAPTSAGRGWRFPKGKGTSMPGTLTHEELWRLLVEARCESACLGLLLDMFEAVEFGADLARNQQEVAAEIETGTARVAEELMALLGDQDGDQLREWLLLWRSDSKTFAERLRAFVKNRMGG